MLLGCVADDLTGATDLADALVGAGLTTSLVLGGSAGFEPPPLSVALTSAEAVVVALKTRTIPASDAVSQSVAAWRWLASLGARRAYFKICSTFDSTDAGNIGPVADALAEEVGAGPVLVCPAFPTNGRTVYLGHLFVGRQLLSDSGMRNHPLTPMTDPDLVGVLARQSGRPVGLVARPVVASGPAAVRGALGLGGHLIADAIDDADLDVLGRVGADLPLLVGGSGLAAGLARALRADHPHPASTPADPADAEAAGPADAADAGDGHTADGHAGDAHAGGGGASVVAGLAAVTTQRSPAVVISGSCSEATRAQVAAFGGQVLPVDPLHLDVEGLIAEVGRRVGPAPLLVSSTAGPDEVAAARAELGNRAAGLVEEALAAAARAAVEAGARCVVVAGGETAGAVAAALGVRALEVGPTIAPGVPWTLAEAGAVQGRPTLALALKSGNFGGPAFFAQAFSLLEGLADVAVEGEGAR